MLMLIGKEFFNTTRYTCKASGHIQKIWSEAKVKPYSPPKRGKLHREK
jgi:hypothetical protein